MNIVMMREKRGSTTTLVHVMSVRCVAAQCDSVVRESGGVATAFASDIVRDALCHNGLTPRQDYWGPGGVESRDERRDFYTRCQVFFWISKPLALQRISCYMARANRYVPQRFSRKCTHAESLAIQRLSTVSQQISRSRTPRTPFTRNVLFYNGIRA